MDLYKITDQIVVAPYHHMALSAPARHLLSKAICHASAIHQTFMLCLVTKLLHFVIPPSAPLSAVCRLPGHRSPVQYQAINCKSCMTENFHKVKHENAATLKASTSTYGSQVKCAVSWRWAGKSLNPGFPLISSLTLGKLFDFLVLSFLTCKIR